MCTDVDLQGTWDLAGPNETHLMTPLPGVTSSRVMGPALRDAAKLHPGNEVLSGGGSVLWRRWKGGTQQEDAEGSIHMSDMAENESGELRVSGATWARETTGLQEDNHVSLGDNEKFDDNVKYGRSQDIELGAETLFCMRSDEHALEQGARRGEWVCEAPTPLHPSSCCDQIEGLRWGEKQRLGAASLGELDAREDARETREKQRLGAASRGELQQRSLEEQAELTVV